MSRYSRVPFELRALKQWVVFKIIVRDGKPTKVPYNPYTGRPADTMDPSTWISFQDAEAAESYGYDGIGFVFSADDPYCGIDLDRIMEQTVEIQAVHEQIYKQLNSYSEWSPSGAGIHIICKGSVPTGRNNREKGCEIYSSGRFFTVTGNVCNDVAISSQADLCSTLWAELGGEEKQSIFATVDQFAQPQSSDDAYIIDKALAASNGAKFRRLWEGNWHQDYQSQSEADFTLVNMLQFYTKNPDQIYRLFLTSGLGQREKARRKDYVPTLIAKSFDRELPEVPLNFGAAPMPVLADEQPYAPTSPFQMPPGLLGDIARFIYDAAPRPVAEAALAGAIVMLAGLVGKAFNVSGTGLNHYIMFMAPTAIGKEQMAKGTSRLMSDLAMYCPVVNDFKFKKFASGQGLAKSVAASKTGGCGFLIQEEFGYTLQNISSKNASPSDNVLLQNLLGLYNKSGKTDLFEGMSYSDGTKDIQGIVGPAFSLLGEGVPQSFYTEMNEQTVMSGLLPRFTIIEYNGLRPALNREHHKVKPPEELLKKLAQLVEYSYHRIRANNICEVPFDDATAEIDDKFERDLTALINSTTRNVIKGVWSRVHVKVMKLAALVAVGINPINPIIDENCYMWAKGIIMNESEAMIRKFENGDFMQDVNNLELDQIRVVASYLTDFYRRGVPTKGLRTLPEMLKDGVFLVSDISTKCYKMSAFMKDNKKDMRQKVDRALEALKEPGFIIEFNNSSGTYNASGRMVKIYDYEELTNFLDRI